MVECRARRRWTRERGPSGPGGWPQVNFAGWVTCGDKPQPATLVDFRGSSLSDAGSIPAISTLKRIQTMGAFFVRSGFLAKHIVPTEGPRVVPAGWRGQGIPEGHV